MGRRRTACTICASMKAQCTKGRPCSRCLRLHLTCTDAEVDTLMTLDRSSLKCGSKVGHTRSATGCSSCRQRHKKCDENWPTCGDCLRLQLPCSPPRMAPAPSSSPTWPSPPQNVLPDGTDPPVEIHADLPTSVILSTSWALSIANNLNFSFPVSPKPFADWIGLICSDDDAGMIKMANLANSTASKNLLSCHPVVDESGLRTILPPAVLCELAGVTPQALRDWDIPQRHLLNHFLQNVSRVLVVVPDAENLFLRIMVPMALENNTVRHSLAALSACHISNVYPEWQRDLLTLRGLALEGLRTELQDPRNLSWALVATLLLCLVEICQGTSKKWLLHLHGAKALLDSADYARRLDPPVVGVMHVYNYLCCIASVTSDDVPPTVDAGSPTQREMANGEGGAIHAVFGISEELYRLLNRANRLAGETADEQFDEQVMDIELTVRSWDPGDVSCDMEEEKAAATATQWAIIMLLHQRRKRLRNDDPEIRKMANHILATLSVIRPGSPMEARILFALFMAGVGSMSKSNRLTVEYRLNMMATKGLGNVFVAHRLLDDIWRRANQGEIIDWEVLMRSKYPGLVFA